VSGPDDNQRADDALDRLTDFLVEDVLESSEQDMLDEAADENDEIMRLAAEMKGLFPGRVYELYLQHVSRSKGNVIPFPNQSLSGQPGGEAIAASATAEADPPDGVLSLVVPPPQRARPHWRMMLVAAAAGAMGATLWPYYAKPVMTAFLDEPSHVDGGQYQLTTSIKASGIPSAGIGSDVCRASSPVPQVAASGSPVVLPAGAPASFGLTVDHPSDGAQLVICGFAPGSSISVGRSIDDGTWVLPASGLAEAVLIPPRKFAGPMKVDAVLVNADRTMADRRTLHLQWLPSTLATAGAPEAGPQLEEGTRLQAAGDLARARAVFLPLAQNGDPRASFLLAETYDPISLAKRQLLPPDSDLEMARLWYRRALEQGSPQANARLERLSNW